MAEYITVNDDDKLKINKDTGELEAAQKVVKVDTSAYVMFFLQTIPEFIKLTGNQMRLLSVIWYSSTYNPDGQLDGNLFTNGPLFKQQVRAYGLEWSDSQINNEVSRIVKSSDLLIKIARGSYILNPKYFFKGKLTDRTKLILTITNQK